MDSTISHTDGSPPLAGGSTPSVPIGGPTSVLPAHPSPSQSPDGQAGSGQETEQNTVTDSARGRAPQSLADYAAQGQSQGLPPLAPPTATYPNSAALGPIGGPESQQKPPTPSPLRTGFVTPPRKRAHDPDQDVGEAFAQERARMNACWEDMNTFKSNLRTASAEARRRHALDAKRIKEQENRLSQLADQLTAENSQVLAAAADTKRAEQQAADAGQQLVHLQSELDARHMLQQQELGGEHQQLLERNRVAEERIQKTELVVQNIADRESTAMERLVFQRNAEHAERERALVEQAKVQEAQHLARVLELERASLRMENEMRELRQAHEAATSRAQNEQLENQYLYAQLAEQEQSELALAQTGADDVYMGDEIIPIPELQITNNVAPSVAFQETVGGLAVTPATPSTIELQLAALREQLLQIESRVATTTPPPTQPRVPMKTLSEVSPSESWQEVSLGGSRPAPVEPQAAVSCVNSYGASLDRG